MTVTITQNVTDITGVDDDSIFRFYQADHPRAAADGVTMISTRPVTAQPVSGVLTVQLEPGPAVVQIGARVYPILVPDQNATLWPLIDAGLPPSPSTGSEFVRNFGGVAGVRRVTQSWYAANPHDPDTLYLVIAD